MYPAFVSRDEDRRSKGEIQMPEMTRDSKLFVENHSELAEAIVQCRAVDDRGMARAIGAVTPN